MWDAMTIPSLVSTRLPLTPTASFSCFRILRTGRLPSRRELTRGEVLQDAPRAVPAHWLDVAHADRQPVHAGDDDAPSGTLDVGAREGAGVHPAARVVGGVADLGDELGEGGAGHALRSRVVGDDHALAAEDDHVAQALVAGEHGHR